MERSFALRGGQLEALLYLDAPSTPRSAGARHAPGAGGVVAHYNFGILATLPRHAPAIGSP